MRSIWILGFCSSSAKEYACGAEVARVMSSTAARGEVADGTRARNGSKAMADLC